MSARSRSKLSLIRYVLDVGLGVVRRGVGKMGTAAEPGGSSSHGWYRGGEDPQNDVVAESHDKRSFLELPGSREQTGWNGQDRTACRQRGPGKTGAAATPRGGSKRGQNRCESDFQI